MPHEGFNKVINRKPQKIFIIESLNQHSPRQKLSDPLVPILGARPFFTELSEKNVGLMLQFQRIKYLFMKEKERKELAEKP